MPLLATIVLVGFVSLTFGVRTYLHLRRTGSSGFVGLRPGAGPLERMAGAAMVLAFVLVAAGAWIGVPVLPAWAIPVGLALVVVGTVGTFAAQLTMGDAWRIGVDPSARTELVTRSLFRFVRNPIFTMMIVANIGVALVCSTPLCLVTPLLLVAALEVQVRVVEEPFLLGLHGDAYRRWASHAGRFLPWLGRM